MALDLDTRKCGIDGSIYDASQDLDHAHDPEHPNHYDYEACDPDLGWSGPTCPSCPAGCLVRTGGEDS